MTDNIVFREGRPEDADAAAEIAVIAWEGIWEFYRRAMGDAMFDAVHAGCRESKAAQVHRAFTVEDPQTLVAEMDGRVAGFVTFHADPQRGVGEIGNNAVHPDFRGRGIAGRLYQQVIERFRAMGLRFAKVTTGLDEAHAPARRAYEKAGFTVEIPSITYFRAL